MNALNAALGWSVSPAATHNVHTADHKDTEDGDDWRSRWLRFDVSLPGVARSVVDSRRGAHPKYVFTYRDKPIQTIHNTTWQKARVRAGLPNVRVHDLKHTFGRRLRAAGVSFED